MDYVNTSIKNDSKLSSDSFENLDLWIKMAKEEGNRQGRKEGKEENK